MSLLASRVFGLEKCPVMKKNLLASCYDYAQSHILSHFSRLLAFTVQFLQFFSAGCVIFPLFIGALGMIFLQDSITLE